MDDNEIINHIRSMSYQGYPTGEYYNPSDSQHVQAKEAGQIMRSILGPPELPPHNFDNSTPLYNGGYSGPYVGGCASGSEGGYIEGPSLVREAYDSVKATVVKKLGDKRVAKIKRAFLRAGQTVCGIGTTLGSTAIVFVPVLAYVEKVPWTDVFSRTGLLACAVFSVPGLILSAFSAFGFHRASLALETEQKTEKEIEEKQKKKDRVQRAYLRTGQAFCGVGAAIGFGAVELVVSFPFLKKAVDGPDFIPAPQVKALAIVGCVGLAAAIPLAIGFCKASKAVKAMKKRSVPTSQPS